MSSPTSQEDIDSFTASNSEPFPTAPTGSSLQGDQSPTNSEDSQTVVLSQPSHSNTSSEVPQNAQVASSSGPEMTSIAGAEPRHCWICLVDEGEDTSDEGKKQQWKSPCPCNLRAHEECLLEWIADLEAPSRKGGVAAQILCPQCKAEIYIARPKDYLVQFMDTVTRTTKALVIPMGLSATLGILFSGSMVYGLNSIYLVFGPEVADRLWEFGHETSLLPKPMEEFFRITDPFMMVGAINWKILLGIPSIAPALILSRTRIADNVLAALPMLYFAMHSNGKFLKSWPPSPGFAFSLLPYFRTIYREAYSYAFRDLEKKWDQAVQRKPREGETAEQVAAAERDIEDDGNVINIEIEVEVDGEMDGDFGVGDQPVPPQVAEAVRGNLIERLQDRNRPIGHNVEGQDPPALRGEGQQELRQAWADRIQQAADRNANHPQAGQPEVMQPQANQGQLALVDDAFGREGISVNKVAQSVLGALFLPAISGAMGELLQFILPRSLVQRPINYNWMGQNILGKPTGILQQRWGRSLIGGALFIVLKDALVLYGKWSRAKNHGKRKILDYVDSPGVRNGRR